MMQISPMFNTVNLFLFETLYFFSHAYFTSYLVISDFISHMGVILIIKQNILNSQHCLYDF